MSINLSLKIYRIVRNSSFYQLPVNIVQLLTFKQEPQIKINSFYPTISAQLQASISPFFLCLTCFSTDTDFARNRRFHPICPVYVPLKTRSHGQGIDHRRRKLDSHLSFALTVFKICVGFTEVYFLKV